MRHPRATQLIEGIGLSRHPEGGWYREIHRAQLHVQPIDARSPRPALTVIYFLLTEGEVSRWHRVASDETWHFHEGSSLELLVVASHIDDVRIERVGAWDADTQGVAVVPAGHWQAARCTGPYALVSCTVGPGFVFDDFEMLRDDPDAAQLFAARHPQFAALV